MFDGFFVERAKGALVRTAEYSLLCDAARLRNQRYLWHSGESNKIPPNYHLSKYQIMFLSAGSCGGAKCQR
jgi:hypothetical protein